MALVIRRAGVWVAVVTLAALCVAGYALPHRDIVIDLDIWLPVAGVAAGLYLFLTRRETMRAAISTGLEGILRSRKFWTLILDAVISTVLFFVTKYVNPAAVEDVKYLIAAWQPIILLIIAAWTVEDAVEKYTNVRFVAKVRRK